MLVRAALLEEETGLLDEALADLETASKGPGGEHEFWIMRFTLAGLFWRRSDLGSALQYAEGAVQASIILNNLTLRAVSLFLAVQLHFSVGQVEKSRVLAEVLCKIMNENLGPTAIRLDKRYKYPVFPPRKREVLFLAGLVCAKCGDYFTAESYFEAVHKA